MDSTNAKRAMETKAYLMFIDAVRPQLKKLYPTASFTELGKMLGKLWGESSSRRETFYNLASICSVPIDTSVADKV